MNNKYNDLRYFCSYFGSSWKTDFGTADRTLQFFFKISDISVQQNVVFEIDALLKEFPDDIQLDDALLELGCFYDPSYANLTDREWLRQIQKQIESRLNPPQTAPSQKSSTGISGNTSDDRLRRLRLRESIKRKLRRTLTGMLVIAALWEFDYQCSKMVNGEANVSRFGGIMSMFRQLFGATPHYPKVDKSSQFDSTRQPSLHSTRPQFEATKTAESLNRLSTVRFVARNKPGTSGEEEFVFDVNLYKKDRWFDTGIPIIAGNLIWAYPPDENPNAIISAKIAGNIKDFHIKNNEHPYPSLDLIIVSHAVEYENVVLRNDDIEHLFLKLKENPVGHIRLFVRLDLVNVNGALGKIKQRQIALIEHSWKLAGHYAH
jgi:hypothetical protein